MDLWRIKNTAVLLSCSSYTVGMLPASYPQCHIGLFWHKYIVSNIFGEKVKRNTLVLGDILLWVQIFSTHLFDERPFITFAHCHLHHTATLTSLINQHSQKPDANEQLANKVARSNVDLWLSLSLFVSNVIMHEMYSFNSYYLFRPLQIINLT